MINVQPTKCYFEGDCTGSDPLCVRSLACHWTTEVCPVGAMCTARGSVQSFDADPGGGWDAGITVGYARYLGYGSNWVYFVDQKTCHAEGREDRCTAGASYTTMGIGQPLLALCATVPTGEPRLSNYGPDSVRRIECTAETTITAAPAAGVVPQGTNVSSYAPGPGTVDVAPAGASVRGAALTSAKSTPAFKKLRKTAKAAGPVTFSLKLSPAARKKLARKKRLVVSIKVTFTPKGGGKKVTKTTKVTLRKVTAVKPDIRP